MAVLFADRFASLSQWTLVQNNFVISIDSGTAKFDQTDSDDNSYNRGTMCTTDSVATSAAGHAVFGQFKMTDVTISNSFFPMILAKAFDLDDQFTGTCGCYVDGGTALKLYDDSVGNIGSFTVASDTWYDIKFVFLVSGAVEFYAVASTNPGNLPAGSGSFTLVGTSTTTSMNAQTIYIACNKKTKTVSTDAFVDEFYYTDNGVLQTPPSVSVGADQSVDFPSVITLDATVTDDGLPDPPALVTQTWTKQSGPGTVSFGDASLVDTTATVSAASPDPTLTSNDYVLRLTANDSALTTFDELSVTVYPTDTLFSAQASDFSKCTALTGWTSVNSGAGGTIGIVRKTINAWKLTGTGADALDDLGVYRTSGVVCLFGRKFYWQFKAATNMSAMVVLSKSASIAFSGNASLYVEWTGAARQLNIYDGNSDVVTGVSWTANQWYDIRAEVNSTGTVTFSYRTSPTPGDLTPTSAAWNTLGTTTIAGSGSYLGQTVRVATNIEDTVAAQADSFFFDEFYTTFTSPDSGDSSGGMNVIRRRKKADEE